MTQLEVNRPNIKAAVRAILTEHAAEAPATIMDIITGAIAGHLEDVLGAISDEYDMQELYDSFKNRKPYSPWVTPKMQEHSFTVYVVAPIVSSNDEDTIREALTGAGMQREIADALNVNAHDVEISS